MEIHYGSNIVTHGKTFGSPTSPIEIDLDLPDDFIVGATGRGGYATNKIILVKRDYQGGLTSYVCGSYGGFYKDANVPDPSIGPCFLRFTQGACFGLDCSGAEDRLIHGVRFFWSCYNNI